MFQNNQLICFNEFRGKVLAKQIGYQHKYSGRGNIKVEDKKARGGGGVGTPYNGLHGEAPPERGTFFRLQVYVKGVPFSIKGI